ncbi:MAG: J domain-containing protein, partial [Corynebacterium sp.]|nr:J domain-containing protein [Corynebacterium sp.]
DRVIVPPEHDFAHWREAQGWTDGGGDVALTHYETLGVPRDASRADITAAFRSQMRALHGDAGGDDELAKHVSSAYNVLSNASRRATYDRTRDCRADR